MFDTEENEPFGIEATPLDLNRLDDAEVGDSVESETGTWKAIRYKASWTLLAEVGNIQDFANLKLLKAYLIG